MAEGQGYGPQLLPDSLRPQGLCPTSRPQLCPSVPEAGNPLLSVPLLPQSPLCPSVSLTSFPKTSPLPAPVSPALPSCSLSLLVSSSASQSPFLSLSAPSHLSVFPSPASVLLSRTVWKVEKASWGWEDSCSRGRDWPGLIIKVCQVPSSLESRQKGAAEHFRMCV